MPSPIRRRFPFTPIAIVTLLAAVAAIVAPATAQVDTAAFDKLVQEAREAGKIPALSVAAAKDGTIVYRKAVGFANLEHRVPATPDTRFRTASIAKPMTAIAVMQLAAAGTIDLDAPVRNAITEWPAKRWPITARQLLSHTSGVRHYKFRGEATGTRYFRTLAGTLKLFKDDRLRHEPGTKFTYTTFGYTLLGLLVERASGMTFDDYMKTKVWEPAGMNATTVDHQSALIAHRASGYRRLGKGERARLPASVRDGMQGLDVVNARLHDTSMKIPGGGFLSTATDLVKFGNAILDGTLVDDATRTAMWTAQKTNDGKRLTYGLGFGVKRSKGYYRVSHSGGQAGAACLLVIDVDRKIVVAAMCNLRGGKVGTLVNEIRKRLRA